MAAQGACVQKHSNKPSLKAKIKQLLATDIHCGHNIQFLAPYSGSSFYRCGCDLCSSFPVDGAFLCCAFSQSAERSIARGVVVFCQDCFRCFFSLENRCFAYKSIFTLQLRHTPATISSTDCGVAMPSHAAPPTETMEQNTGHPALPRIVPKWHY